MKVTVDKQARNVILDCDGAQVAVTYTALRALWANGLKDAVRDVVIYPAEDAIWGRVFLDMEAHAEAEKAKNPIFGSTPVKL